MRAHPSLFPFPVSGIQGRCVRIGNSKTGSGRFWSCRLHFIFSFSAVCCKIVDEQAGVYAEAGRVRRPGGATSDGTDDRMRRIKSLIGEFVRYLFVGGLSFVVDFLVLCFFQELVFHHVRYGLYYSTALGFLSGLTVNYILSVTFVFAVAKKTNAGRSPRDMIVFAVIGIVGLILSEIGMYAGADLLDFPYQFVKIAVTAFVLIWNYLGRKLLIFQERDAAAAE